MIGSIFKGITKIFGSKSDRDLKTLIPIVTEINTAYAALQNSSDEELRGKTLHFKAKICRCLNC